MVLGILGHHLRGEGRDFAGSRGIRRYWDQWGVRLGLLSPGLRRHQGELILSLR